jgi:hypothetical protein
MRKALIVLALAGALVAGPSALLDPLWSLLSTVWSESSPDAGCGFDPDGGCNPAPRPDEGCGADPSGCPKGS